nr:hypothetical protein [Tanacetum cinerariifolium]
MLILRPHTRICLTLFLSHLFKKISDQKDNTQDSSANTKFAKQPIIENLPTAGKTNALSKPVTLNSVSTPQESKACNNSKIDSHDVISKVVYAMCKKCLIFVNHDKCLSKNVHGKKSCGKNQKAKVSVKEIQKTYQPKVAKPKTVGTRESLATPKPRKPRHLLRWSLTGRLFDQEGKIVDSSQSKSKSDCSNSNNACTSNNIEPKIKRFPNSTSLLDRNDHVAAILGFGDLQWGNILITRVYFIEGLGHNLFSVGQFCDSDLEVAFRRDACFVRNLEGVDLLKGDRSTNLYTINLHEISSASPICLMARASSTKNDLVASLLKFKYHKEHLCPSCEQGKKQKSISSTKSSSKFEAKITSFPYGFVWSNENCKYKWKAIRFGDCGRLLSLHSPVIIIRTDNGTEFKNQVLKEYFDTVGIFHQMSSVRTPQQNGVVERHNRTLVEAARTMLIFSCAPLFLWAEEIATACFTQNRSIIHRRFNKTPYEQINGRKLDISFLHVFGALCYPRNDCEDIGKLGAKGDIGFSIGYSVDSCAYRVYNRQTKKIIETINVLFDELSAMAFEQRSSKPRLNSMTSGHISSGLDLTYAPSTITTLQPSEGELDLLFEAMYDDYIGGQPSATRRTILPAPEPQVRQTSMASTTIADTAPIPTNSSSYATNISIASQDVDELNPNAMIDGNTFVNPFENSSTSAAASSLLAVILLK